MRLPEVASNTDVPPARRWGLEQWGALSFGAWAVSTAIVILLAHAMPREAGLAGGRELEAVFVLLVLGLASLPLAVFMFWLAIIGRARFLGVSRGSLVGISIGAAACGVIVIGLGAGVMLMAVAPVFPPL
jgi:hypothetical protein